MINASELYTQYIVKPQIDECLADIEPYLIEAAKNGKTNIQYRGFGFSDPAIDEDGTTPLQYLIMKELVELGYVAKIRIDPKILSRPRLNTAQSGQLLDYCLQIEWHSAKFKVKEL